MILCSTPAAEDRVSSRLFSTLVLRGDILRQRSSSTLKKPSLRNRSAIGLLPLRSKSFHVACSPFALFAFFCLKRSELSLFPPDLRWRCLIFRAGLQKRTGQLQTFEKFQALNCSNWFPSNRVEYAILCRNSARSNRPALCGTFDHQIHSAVSSAQLRSIPTE